jgi:hypothetical protein
VFKSDKNSTVVTETVTETGLLLMKIGSQQLLGLKKINNGNRSSWCFEPKAKTET